MGEWVGIEGRYGWVIDGARLQWHCLAFCEPTFVGDAFVYNDCEYFNPCDGTEEPGFAGSKGFKGKGHLWRRQFEEPLQGTVLRPAVL